MLTLLFNQQQKLHGLLALWSTAIASGTRATTGAMVQTPQILDAIGQLLIQSSGDLEQQASHIDGQAQGERTLGGGAAPQYIYAVPAAVKKTFSKPVIAAYASLKQGKQGISGSADVVDLELLAFAVGELIAA